MPAYQEPMYLSDVLLTEVARGWTTQAIKLKTATALAIGTVLYQVAGQEYLTAEPSDYSAVVGILADNAKASDEVQTSLAIVRGAVVAGENLIFPANANAEQQKQSLASLNTLGIAIQGEPLPVIAQGDSTQDVGANEPSTPTNEL